MVMTRSPTYYSGNFLIKTMNPTNRGLNVNREGTINKAVLQLCLYSTHTA